tara:strand:+ start:441 stop:1346 length:906 start_codon:yes stop_codon:yes gene_type:complete
MSLKNQTLKEKFGRNLMLNENLSKYNWFNLGGCAEIFFKPENKEQLKKFLFEIKDKKFEKHVLGAGSNTLIRDLGVNGTVIKLGPKFSEIKLLKDNVIEVGAATLDKKISEFAKNHSISGMEFLSCIPGSIGGSVIMNSGCYGSEMSEILQSILVVDYNGKEKEISKDQIQFNYRGTNLPDNYIILSARLKGALLKKEIIEKKQNELIKKKKETQPSQIKTAGSTFKNSDQKAWKLIKETNSDKFYVGGAKISEKHCNFFVNDGSASASDIEKLIEKVKKNVKSKTGINLELEIKIIGNEK